MEIFPAIDLRGGGAVRLVQGDFERERSYGDPRTLAERFAAAGPAWLHVVDLEGARSGHPVQRPLVIEIAGIAARHGVAVQTGGGVRSPADVEELLGAGVGRVVLGTAALADPDLLGRMCSSHPDRIVLGLDYRRVDGDRLVAAAHGWTGSAGQEVEAVLADDRSAGVAAVVATAIDRDGTLEGPDLGGLARLLAATDGPVIASGGVGSLADIEALASLEVDGRRLAGVVVGRALVDGRIDLEDLCARSG